MSDAEPEDLWANPIAVGARVRVSRQTLLGRVISIEDRMVDVLWDDGSKWCAGFHVAARILELVRETDGGT